MEHGVKHLYDFIDPQNPDLVLNEILHIARLVSADSICGRLSAVHADIVRLFNGEYPGYRANTTKYHNLEHTCSVALATARLMHGCTLDGVIAPSPRDVLVCLAAAYFHDTGLIQERGDTEGTGAKYTVGHEERSIRLMRRYMEANAFSADDIRDCAHMIQCTILNLDPKNIPFVSEQMALLGRIVGSADLIAQLADPTYLEKLRLLFLEFEEAKLPGFASEMELIMKTEAFYSNVAKRRLDGGLTGVYRHMQPHFRNRLDIGDDLYAVAMEGNIAYIRKLADQCQQQPECYDDLIRRELDDGTE